jgi:hypothetical protein
VAIAHRKRCPGCLEPHSATETATLVFVVIDLGHVPAPPEQSRHCMAKRRVVTKCNGCCPVCERSLEYRDETSTAKVTAIARRPGTGGMHVSPRCLHRLA